MRTALHMFIVLTLVTTLSGGLLAAFDEYTSPHILANKTKVLKQAISDVLPVHDFYQELEDDSRKIYIGMLESSGQPVGIAFQVIGNGFQGKIAMMVGMNPDFNELTGLKVLEQIETPGLGTKIEEDPSNLSDRFWFTKQFKGVNPWPQIQLIKNKKTKTNHQVQGITGATISSQSVVRILNDQIGRFKEIYHTNRQ